MQRDGRRYVTETHTLTDGPPVVVNYLAPVGADYVAIRDARVARINEQLAQAEFEELIGGD